MQHAVSLSNEQPGLVTISYVFLYHGGENMCAVVEQ